jgi:hypothetical protein
MKRGKANEKWTTFEENNVNLGQIIVFHKEMWNRSTSMGETVLKTEYNRIRTVYKKVKSVYYYSYNCAHYYRNEPIIIIIIVVVIYLYFYHYYVCIILIFSVQTEC